VLRLAFSPSVAAPVIAACRRLLHDRPAAMLRLDEQVTGQLLEGLRAGDHDLVVGPLPSEPLEGLASTEVFSDRFHIVADCGHPLLERQSLLLADLAQVEWLLPQPGRPLREFIESACRSHGLPPPLVRVETRFGARHILDLVQGTRMVTCATAASLQHAAALRPLQLAPGQLELDRRVGVLYRANAYLSPLARRFAELLAEGAAVSKDPRDASVSMLPPADGPT